MADSNFGQWHPQFRSTELTSVNAYTIPMAMKNVGQGSPTSVDQTCESCSNEFMSLKNQTC